MLSARMNASPIRAKKKDSNKLSRKSNKEFCFESIKFLIDVAGTKRLIKTPHGTLNFSKSSKSPNTEILWFEMFMSKNVQVNIKIRPEFKRKLVSIRDISCFSKMPPNLTCTWTRDVEIYQAELKWYINFNHNRRFMIIFILLFISFDRFRFLIWANMESGWLPIQMSLNLV